MKVLVDASPARDGGGVTYVVEELRAINAVAPDLELVTLASPWAYQRLAADLPTPVVRVPVRNVAERFAYQQVAVPRRARAADVLYCPLNFGPVVSGSNTVLTLHNPNYFGSGLSVVGSESARPWVKVWACHASLRRCRVAVAISDSFRDEIVATTPDVAAKLRVVKSGAPVWTGPGSRPAADIPDRFHLVVASGAPHKRLETTVAGWAGAVRAAPETAALVIVGALDAAAVARHRSLAGEAAPSVVHLGGVSDRAVLRWLYEHATALVSMSVLEAFPLTLVEATSVGCPMVLSDIPPHREVSRGEAVFVRPDDPRALTDALAAFDAGARPCPRPWPGTWEEHARSMVSIFSECAAGGGRGRR